MEIDNMIQRLIRLLTSQKKYFQSDIQKTLNTFDRNHDWTDSQKAEIAKHRRIHSLRDNPQQQTPSPLDWLEKEDNE